MLEQTILSQLSLYKIISFSLQAAGTSLLSSPSMKKSFTPSNSPLSRMTSITSRTATTPRAAKEQDILRAVLQASHTPQMQRMSSPLNAGSIFTPEEKSSPAEEENDMVTRLRDLGLNSVGSSNRKRRRSQRRKSRKEESRTDDVEKENTVCKTYQFRGAG